MMIENKKAIYFGTTIPNQKTLLVFPKRYKEKNIFMRGNGNLSIDSNYIYFSYYGMDKKFSIPIKSITKVDIGKGHAGQHVFKRCILKIYWNENGQALILWAWIFTDLDYVKDQLSKMIK